MVVTCKIKHQNIFANVLQMFYFTCNHGLILCRYVRIVPVSSRHVPFFKDPHVFDFSLEITHFTPFRGTWFVYGFDKQLGS